MTIKEASFSDLYSMYIYVNGTIKDQNTIEMWWGAKHAKPVNDMYDLIKKINSEMNLRIEALILTENQSQQ